ncbi:phosphate transport system regulatory protein PhoU [Salipaludibacillus neizhouensis]|uniref:Phosphate-specific transport system accessory protein PhoU n=1 Tax=Salipaludibacillus neizhouensis TaxID=885475 RepID=A0A3A9K5E1_9BACI|nr:phosphate signaling complex protein PhoU [Salipaludibacillus neizhouensis]RKL67797.1 phosphate transport system regulatory protein PhoU [Salipaludibacillus neizhouensis]
MTVRENFNLEMIELKEEIKLLGSMVEKAFFDTMDAFHSKNKAKFEQIIENDKYINAIELDINEKATLLIAKQQPVASDLRKIIVALKVSSDLERMGDLAVDLAKAAERMHDYEKFKEYEISLLEMANKAQHMMNNVLIAYKESKVMDAQHVASMDDVVDAAYGEFIWKIINITITDKRDIEHITQMTFIARYIERIADYCTNISEWIIYEVNGQRFDLN